MSKTLNARYLESSRVSVIRDDPDMIVLTMRAADKDSHFMLSRSDFQALARQMGYDAKLLSN